MEGFAYTKAGVKKDKLAGGSEDGGVAKKEFGRLLLSVEVGRKVWF